MTLATFRKTKTAAAALAVFGLASVTSITQAADITTEYSLSVDVAKNYDMQDIVLGPSGNLWFPVDGHGSAGNCDSTNTSYIGEVTPAGTITKHDVRTLTRGALPSPFCKPGLKRIAFDSTTSSVWFTESATDFVHRMDATGTVVASVDVSNLGVGALTPQSILVANGSVWVWPSGAPQTILRLNATTPTTLQANITLPNNSVASFFAVGPDGKIWFTSDVDFSVFNIDPATNTVSSPISLGNGKVPHQIISGGAGSDTLWVAVGDGTIAKIVASTGAVTFSSAIPLFAGATGNNGNPFSLALGNAGELWVALSSSFAQNGSRIAKYIIASDSFKPFTTATQESFPSSIVKGSDGNMWFMERGDIGNGVPAAPNIATFAVGLPVSLQSFKVD